MTISPILDQPQSIDYAALPGGPIARLANHEIACLLDADCNPQDLFWPWADQVYVRSVRLRVFDLQDGELVPLVTRFFAGHQETIAGTEGVIITKRLGVPYKATDDRALFWLLECQAEGDRVLRPVSYTHLRAHETVLDLVCRLLLEKKKLKPIYTHHKPNKHTTYTTATYKNIT